MRRRLRRHEDGFGAEIAALVSGERDVNEIIERDDGRIEAYPASYMVAPARKWPPIERRAIALARGRVLDVGAGAGRVSLELQRRGLRVTAIDNSPLAMQAARKRGVRDARVLDVAAITPRLGTFDTIAMLGNNFGLAGSPAATRRLLRTFARMTAPDAVILAETLDPYGSRDPGHRAYHARNLARGRPAGQTRIRARFRQAATPWFDLLFMSPAEMREIVDGTGWTVERILADTGPVFIGVLRTARK
jgi:SAM-dependent methyltransferase